MEEKRMLSRHVVGSVGGAPSGKNITEWLVGISTGVHASVYPLSKTVERNKNQAGLAIAGEWSQPPSLALIGGGWPEEAVSGLMKQGSLCNWLGEQI